ncbi:MAG TPA: winged helix-turn-helix domain-containing protein [Bryobacteraceae bacterium]|nr:winged helix-turn-helix domain-containing protein [Bryobacteraceae bacterium]
MSQAGIYQFGPYRISVAERVLRRHDQLVSLTPKCFDTLLVLAQHGGDVVDKESLIRAVWPDSFVEEGSLAQNVFTLRKALGETPDGAQYIQTIPKRGYRLIIPKTELIATAPPADASAPRPNARPGGIRRLSRLLATAAAITLTLIGAGRAWWAIGKLPADIQISPLPVANSLAYAVISPDGKRIAYVGKEADGQSVWIRQTTGLGAGRRLAGPLDGHIWGISYSPKGDYLYYVFEDRIHPVLGVLYRIPSQGGEARKLMTRIAGAPSFSPDGSQIIFKHYEANDRGYLLMATAMGTEARVVATSRASYSFNNYQWAADAKSVYYVEGNRDPGGSAWSVLELPATQGPASVVMAPQTKPLRSVNWLSRSEILALSPDEDSGISQIWRFRMGSPARRLTNGTTDYSVFSVTADARTILANSVETQDSIWTGPAPGASRDEPVRVALPTGSYNSPVWTPDGHIVYVGQSNLWVATANGAERRPLLPQNAAVMEPVVSADGRFVVFVLRRQGSQNLWRINLDGSGFRQVTTGRLDWHPALSLDGKWVAYDSNVQGLWAVWKAPLDGSGPAVKLLDSWLETPAISPDSQFMAYPTAIGQIQIRSFENGSLVREMNVPADASDLRWSADGKALTFVSQANRTLEFWSEPADGGRPARSGVSLPADAQQVSWSRDGKRIVYLRREVKVDLALITNFR